MKSFVVGLALSYAAAFSSNSTKRSEFPCETPAIVPARNVHELAAGNIDIVASMGDSINAGFGLDATSVVDLVMEWRGRTWVSGGEFDYEDRITVPSILKKFNPELKGASTSRGGPNTPQAGLNVAISGAIAQGMPGQARTLVSRLAAFPRDEYKLINLWIGGNDLCAVCNGNTRNQPPAYIAYIQEAIDILLNDLQNVFINLISIIDVGSLKVVAVGAECILGRSFCSCGTGNEEQLERVRIAATEMQRLTYDLGDAYAERFDREGRDDAAVVVQPFFLNTLPPLNPDGTGDLSFFAPDCFHFSGKGHVEGAKALWLNMFEEVGAKTESWDFAGGDSITCPSGNRFLRTHRNSAKQP